MMFFSKNKRAGTLNSIRRSISDESAVTILTSGCHFNGKLYCKGSSRIGGRIEGEIISEGTLILEESAVIEADVKAEDVILHGKCTGTFVVSSKIELSESAVFDGDLETPSLTIQQGAKFNGQIKMLQQDTSNFVGIDELHKKKVSGIKDLGSVTELNMSK